MPDTGQVLIMLSRKHPTDFGDPWMGKGFAFDMISLVACRS